MSVVGLEGYVSQKFTKGIIQEFDADS